MVFRSLKSLLTARPRGEGRSPAEIRDLIRSLRGQPPAERRGANVSLTDPGVDEAFVPVLIEATRDGDAYIRASAVHALGHYPLTELRKARGVVLSALRNDPDAAVRGGAAEALGCCAARCSGALIDALGDADPEVRASAVASLAMAGTDGALEAVTRAACTDREAEVRRRAVYELGVMKDTRWLDVLLQATRDTHERVRAEALYALHETAREASDELIAVFIDAVSDPCACVREQGCHALRYSRPQAVPSLMRALADEDARVRLEAVISLGSLDAVEAVDAITGLMRSDPDEDVRSYAASALADIRRAQAAQRRATLTTGVTEGVRRRVGPVEAPGGTCSATELAALCEALGDPAVEVRLGAARTLGSLLPRFHEQDPGAMLPPPCRAAVAAGLADTSSHVRVQLCTALQEGAGPPFVEPLIERLEDEDDDVRAQAALALASTVDARAFEPLKRLLLREEAARVRRRVVWALSFFPRRDGLPLLMHGLLDPDEHVREQAVLALAEVSSADELADVLERLPPRATDDVRQALACAVDEAFDRGGGTPNRERRVRMGTVHYE